MSADQPVLLVVKQAITTGSLEGVVEQALIAVASLSATRYGDAHRTSTPLGLTRSRQVVAL